jgi:hypothetical protein
VGFVVDKMALEQIFSKYFGFLCQFSFHGLLYTHLSSRACIMGPLVACVPSKLSLTTTRPTITTTKEKKGGRGRNVWPA